jgi:protein ImuB
VRTIALRFPDWPVYVIACAQGWDLLTPEAVVDNHRIAAANRAARHAGVKVGMKARHALGVCPSLTVAEEDAEAEATAHEEVLTGLEQVTASVETLRPGLLAVPAGSLTRYYGSEEQAVELLVDAAARAGVDCVPGVADDLVTAVWASFTGTVLAPGASAAWVATQPVGILTAEPVLGAPTVMVETLSDLGIRTLADFAALPRRDVVGRFGADAATWHRIAAGEPERTVSPVQVTGQPQVHVEPDEPVTSTEAAAFLARRAAAQLHTAQRIRWQLDGWLTRVNGRGGGSDHSSDSSDSSDGTADAAGIRSVTLIPVECVPAGDVVETLWGGPDDGIRAARAAAARAQALIGTRAVLRPVHRGGYTVTGGVVTVPYGEEDPEEVQALPTRHWEGAVPAPLPGLLASGGGKVHLLDGTGAEVQVSGRGLLSAAPDRLVRGDRGDRGGRSVAVTGWAGPWPVDERWWDAPSARRYARLQIATDEPGAHLLLCRDSSWIIEGSY